MGGHAGGDILHPGHVQPILGLWPSGGKKKPKQHLAIVIIMSQFRLVPTVALERRTRLNRY